MDSGIWRKVGRLALSVVLVWLGVRYLLPILLPFALGLMFALMAEPGVRFLQQHLHFSRSVACGIAVSAGFLMIFGFVWILGAIIYRELTVLAAGLPGYFEQISGVVSQVRDWAMGLVARAPEGLSQGLTQWIGNLFTSGSVLLEEAATGVIGVLGSIMGGIPGGALLVGTAVISSFMISAQLPAIRMRLKKGAYQQWLRKWHHAFLQIKEAVMGWLKAQVKLSGVTMLIVGAGFLILRVNNPLFWAVVTALVDAVPMLGTGTVLIPWCLWSLIQGESIRALGLLGLYVTAMLTRSALEPKLVGSHLGMNPLLTLLALYAGYQLWGVPGMIFAPILAVTVKQLMTIRE